MTSKGPIVEHMELYTTLCGSLDGRGISGLFESVGLLPFYNLHLQIKILSGMAVGHIQTALCFRANPKGDFQFSPMPCLSSVSFLQLVSRRPN